jgi:DNA polymerase III delta prime subunit
VKKPWLFIIAGAPGTGKTTLAYALAKRLKGFFFEIGILREIHLDPAWTQANRKEADMTLENYVFMLKNYAKNGLGPVFAGDLGDEDLVPLLSQFCPEDYLVITVTVTDPTVHKMRVINPKDDRGFRRFDAAIAWNKKVMGRPTMASEIRVESDKLTVKQEVSVVLSLLKSPSKLAALWRRRPLPSKASFFDLFRYFETHRTPPWGTKPQKDANLGWQRALKK